MSESEKDGMISSTPIESHILQGCESGRRSLLQSPWILHIIAFISYSVVFWSWREKTNIGTCVEKLSYYSPALEKVSDEYLTVRWNISATTPSPWAGPPSKEVDAAWHKYTNLGAMIISEEDLVKVNGSRYSARVPKEVGDGYIGHVEWYHQLHCVYMLWQQTYPEWYTEEAEMRAKEPVLWHEHLDHCAETLRAAIMCHADAGIVPSNWVKGRHWPHPNYNLDHKCRSFDAAYQWVYDHQANPPPGFELFSRPAEGGYSEYLDLPFNPFDAGIQIPLKGKNEQTRE